MRARITASLSLLVLGLTITASAASAQTAARVCKDGTTSTVTGRGACSGHGGVDAKATDKAKKAATKAEKKLDKAQDKAVAKADKAEDKSLKDANGATAQCKDGTYSHAKTTRGACSGHGGIAKGLKS
ncbi:MAG: hypothetical protein JWM41_1002 [Gemmatimonadetes bacterium]|nr:hypothetical protein [Gemmatimonadota bacterium]